MPRLGVGIGLVFASLCLGSCADKDPEPDPEDTNPGLDTYNPPDDMDGDGWTVESGDCDDENSSIRPGADEECNGLDDNCNGIVDESFEDTDGDDTADCIDVEDCDGVDNDGDGEIDEDFEDSDGDGIADCLEDEECDGIDNDADGEIDEGYDVDGDGYTECGSEEDLADCDDSDSSVSPGADEVAGDLIDNDCDGLVDEGDWAAGDIFISEVMNNPASVTDPSGEWIELYNASDRTLVLNGVVLSATDGDWHMIESADLISVESGSYIVIANNGDYYSNGGVTASYVYSDVSLANESDDLTVEADGITIDQVSWDDGVSFPDPSGASMSLDPTFLDDLSNDDGLNWCEATQHWSEDAADLGSPGSENEACWPVAVATYDMGGSLYSCDTLQLDGSGSYDPDGLDVSWDWELNSAPAGSDLTTSDIEDTEDMNPVFVPDIGGTYVFTLTVFNGTEYSPPSSLSVVIGDRPWNTDPTADAGSDQEYDEDSVCQSISYGVSYECDNCEDYDFDLDGSASTDPDGDYVDSPTWSIVSDAGGYASIDNEDSWTPTVTVSGVPAEYGDTESAEVEVELQVTDCMGATDTDTVMLTYNCTGS
jgi:hypothetical protein